MPAPTPDEISARSRATLEAFVLRARRVTSHSLMSDQATFTKLLQGQISVTHEVETGRQILRTELPDEELVESAAARVRPIILQSDPVYWEKALKALKQLLREHLTAEGEASDPAAREFMDVLSRDWKRANSAEDVTRGYTLVHTGPGVPGGTASMTDNQLALAWFYGDVVHADPKRRAGSAYVGIRERYRAAAHMVAGVMFVTMGTLRFISIQQSLGRLGLDPEVFEEQVAVGEPVWEQEGELLTAPVGTPLDAEALGDDMPGFERYIPEALRSRASTTEGEPGADTAG